MKTMIVVSARRDTGKSNALVCVAGCLPFDGGQAEYMERDGDDLLVIGVYRGTQIGIVTQGDPRSHQEDWLRQCAERGCEIVVTACRLTKPTTECVKKAASKDGYRQVWTAHYAAPGTSEEVRTELNRLFAGHLIELINQLITKEIAL